MCALFVFGRNVLDMRKFGLDFHTRPSKWRQITSAMGQGVCVYACACVCCAYVCVVHVCVCCVYVCVCLCVVYILCIILCFVCVCCAYVCMYVCVFVHEWIKCVFHLNICMLASYIVLCILLSLLLYHVDSMIIWFMPCVKANLLPQPSQLDFAV